MTTNPSINSVEQRERSPINSLFNSDLPVGDNDGDILLYVFCTLLDAMGLRQNTILNDSKKLKNKADIASNWEKMEEAMKFPTITQTFKDPVQEMAYIQRIQEQEKEVQNQKNYCQNIILTVRQSNQVVSTQANADVSSLEQMSSMNAAFVQMLSSIGQIINQKMH